MWNLNEFYWFGGRMPWSSGSRCSVALNKTSCLFRIMNKNIPLESDRIFPDFTLDETWESHKLFQLQFLNWLKQNNGRRWLYISRSRLTHAKCSINMICYCFAFFLIKWGCMVIVEFWLLTASWASRLWDVNIKSHHHYHQYHEHSSTFSDFSQNCQWHLENKWKLIFFSFGIWKPSGNWVK